MRLIGTGLAVAALLLGGCTPLYLQQGPRTLAPGKVSVGVATGASHTYGGPGFDDGSHDDFLGVNQASIRVGLASQVDAGAQVASTGIRVDGKVMLLSGPGLTLSVDGGLNRGYVNLSGPGTSTTTNISGADAALLLGLPVGTGGGELFLAGRGGYFDISQSGGGTYDYVWGGAAGLRLPTGGIFVMPEVGVYSTEGHPGASKGILITPGVGISTEF